MLVVENDKIYNGVRLSEIMQIVEWIKRRDELEAQKPFTDLQIVENMIANIYRWEEAK